MLLQVKNVEKSFAGNQVLKDVNLSVNKGDVVVILGPSGSGKTTFLRCLNFLEQADGGQMEFGNIQLDFAKAAKSQSNEIRKKTAFVFQGYNLFANKTALENVMLGLTTGRGIPKADAEKILDLLNELDKAKNNALSDAINSRFGMVKWVLWEYGKNGGYKNVCIPTVDGMSLLDISANKAKKVLGKLDICNSIQKITGNCLPIFADDIESLDSENMQKAAEMTGSQLILLKVEDLEKLEIVEG